MPSSNFASAIEQGLNFKLNEFQCALGILQLKELNNVISQRKIIFNRYVSNLSSKVEIKILDYNDKTNYNYAYFPIELRSNFSDVKTIIQALNKIQIIPRKYFYPLVCDFDCVKEVSVIPDNLKNARRIVNNILCLPIFPGLELSMVDDICNVLINIK